MTKQDGGAQPDAEPKPDGAAARKAAADRARLDRIFGDVLPETTSDERARGNARRDDSDAWLRQNVPPHHG